MSALGVALIRARESDRSDRLYEDPHARTVVEAARTGFDDESWRRIDALAGDFYPGRTVGVRLVDDHVRRAITASSAPGSTRWRLVMNADADGRRFRELRRLVAGPDGVPAPGPTSATHSPAEGWSETFRRWDDLASALGRPEACTGNPQDGVVESVRVADEERGSTPRKP